MELKSVGGESDYQRSINAAVRMLWTGQGDLYRFVDDMVGTVTRGLTRAWNEGAGSCGIQPGDFSMDERITLQGIINGEISHILGFGHEIEKNSRANKGKIKPLLDRASMWGNRYAAVKYQAQTTACADLKLKFVWNPLKEHCDSCRKLNGRVYRASVWKKYDIYPRSRRLQCGGWRCGCRFEVTQEPVTPGYPPAV